MFIMHNSTEIGFLRSKTEIKTPSHNTNLWFHKESKTKPFGKGCSSIVLQTWRAELGYIRIVDFDGKGGWFFCHRLLLSSMHKQKFFYNQLDFLPLLNRLVLIVNCLFQQLLHLTTHPQPFTQHGKDQTQRQGSRQKFRRNEFNVQENREGGST